MPEITTREDVLFEGLVDWIPLYSIHRIVAQKQPDAPTAQIQSQVLQIIESLAAEGLITVGNLADRGSRFVSWDMPLAAAMQRLQNVYVNGFADKNSWSWFCWVDLTADGTAAAEAVEAKFKGRPDN